ncbi:MAG: methyltransferase domain-containing protein [Planctomycetaceae bacterium]|nr:methyltransferase domain-containing protein [Planctomycetaceae bacterium]
MNQVTTSLPTSPITGSSNVSLLREIDTAALARRWSDEFGIAIQGLWDVGAQIQMFRCRDSQVTFAHPASASGTGGLYEKLQQFSWYYMPFKWEHQQAVNDIAVGDRVLEVGCGAGGFLQRLKSSHVEAMGLELNEAAARHAGENGLHVECCPLHRFAEKNERGFDVVCHFEVLEHVSNIRSFLEDCLRLLRPGGKLLFALPNMDSFLKHDPDGLLNLPPHHMSQWIPASIRYLEQILPIRMQQIAFEPLTDYHVDYYTEIQWRRLASRVTRGHRFILPAVCLYRSLLRNSVIRRLVRGHTMYACFTLTR